MGTVDRLVSEAKPEQIVHEYELIMERKSNLGKKGREKVIARYESLPLHHKKKKAGVVLDNYKVEKFLELLKFNGFTDVEVLPITEAGVKDLTAIKVNILPNELNVVNLLCLQLEDHFKLKTENEE